MLQDSVAELPSFWASLNSWFTPTVFFVLLNLMIATIALTSTLANQTKHHNQTHDVSQELKLNLARSPSLLQRVRSFNFNGYKQQQQQQQQQQHPSFGTQTVVTSDASHFVLPAESHSFFSFDNTHNPETYIFDNANKEAEHEELENQFGYFQQENGQLLNTQYEFEQHKDFIAECLGDNAFIETGSHHLNLQNIGEEEEEHGEDGDEVQKLEEVYTEVTGHHVSRTKSDTLPSAGEIPVKLRSKMKKSASMKSAFGHFEAEDIVEVRRPSTVRQRGVSKVEEADEEVDAKADDFINKFKQQLKLQRIDSIARYKEMITRGSAK